MRKQFVICVALVAAGLCLVKAWNKERKSPLQAPSVAVHIPIAVPATAFVAKPTGEEESEPVEVIDLSQLPFQKPDPVTLPELTPDFLTALAVTRAYAEEDPAGPTPVVPEFLPFAADRDATGTPVSKTWTNVVRFIWGLPAREAAAPEGSAYGPAVMPSKPAFHHPGCPYGGGCPYDGSQYRPAAIAGGAKPTSEEAQDPPAKKNPTKRNTMEIRPGDLPAAWFWKPF